MQIMIHFKKSLALILFFYCTLVFASEEGFHSITVRDEVKQPFWLIEPENPVGIVILFAGGGGNIKISDNGIKRKGNFLVRSRNRFSNQGFVTAVVDKPSDRSSMHYFRTSAEHAQDIASVMRFLRKRHPGKPLWLIGTSRGTISVANAGARLKGNDGANGIVLTATVTQLSNDGDDTVYQTKLDQIKVPTLIVHHKEDGCYVTPYKSARKLQDDLLAVKVKHFMEFSGGKNKSNPCKAKSFHGFLGIEDDVVIAISDWIKQQK